jgi:hypothetical protein
MEASAETLTPCLIVFVSAFTAKKQICPYPLLIPSVSELCVTIQTSKTLASSWMVASRKVYLWNKNSILGKTKSAPIYFRITLTF